MMGYEAVIDSGLQPPCFLQASPAEQTCHPLQVGASSAHNRVSIDEAMPLGAAFISRFSIPSTPSSRTPSRTSGRVSWKGDFMGRLRYKDTVPD